MKLFRSLIWGRAAVVALASMQLQANTVGTDFQLFNPTHDPDNFITVQSARTLDKGQLHLGLFVDAGWSTLPEILSSTEVVSEREGFDDMVISAHAQIGIGILDNWDLGITVPFVLNTQNDDFDKVLFKTTGTSQVRAETKFRFFGDSYNGVALIVGAAMNMIEANPYHGEEDNTINYMIQLAGNKRFGALDVGLNVGYRMRDPGTPEDVFVEGDSDDPRFVEGSANDGITAANGTKPINPLESNVMYGVGFGYNLSKTAKVILEGYGSYALDEVDNYTGRSQSPVEAALGIRLRPKKNLYFYGGLASEITHGVGTADYRVFAGARYTPQLFGGGVAEVQEQTTEVPEPQIEEPMIEEPIIEEPIVEAPAIEEYVAPTVDETPQQTIVAKSIHFKSGSHTQVLKSSRSEVVRIGNLLKQTGFGRLKIIGHTDSQGSAASNQALSERRANMIKGYLVRKHGFNADSIFTEGMGENKPIDTNDTPQGRKNNRRVEFQIFQ
jgi:outer membrane protein OmpA-like peptidoglycan-associated protein